MPKTKNAMLRYQILDRLLSDRYHNYSLDDLTEAVCEELAEIDPKTNGITRRSIEKDIAFLEFENKPMAEIERYTVDSYNREKQRTTRKHCLRYADQGFSIFNQDMSDEERELLSGALSLLGHFEGLPNLDQLEALRWKVRLKPRKNKVISLSRNPIEKSNILGQLFNTIIHKQVIRLIYHRFKEPEDTEFVVNPYLLKEFNRRWYLICKDYDSDTVRNLAIDRVVKVEQLPSYKYEDPDGNVCKRYDEIVGVTYLSDNPIQRIVFWVSDVSDDYVITKPIHLSQRLLKGKEEEELRQLHPSLSGGSFFSIECRRNYELIRELIALGPELVVLSPDDIIEEIGGKIKNMVMRYCLQL